jgi:hypothetical protein
MLAQGILAALLGMTLGCGGSSPAGPTPTITPTPVTPAPVAPGVYTVTASTNTVAPGGQLSVNWTTSIAYPWDWISLDREGEAGQYEFRYPLDDESDAGRSSPVTVGAGR